MLIIFVSIYASVHCLQENCRFLYLWKQFNNSCFSCSKNVLFDFLKSMCSYNGEVEKLVISSSVVSMISMVSNIVSISFSAVARSSLQDISWYLPISNNFASSSCLSVKKCALSKFCSSKQSMYKLFKSHTENPIFRKQDFFIKFVSIICSVCFAVNNTLF